VPRAGGWRAWGAVRGDFEHRLAGQESPAVTGPLIEGEVRRGANYVRVAIIMTVDAADVARALTAAWRVFRGAAAMIPRAGIWLRLRPRSGPRCR
jgi:hypothetical protein